MAAWPASASSKGRAPPPRSRRATNVVLDDQGRTAVIDRDGRITVLDRHHNPVTSVDVPGATGLGFSQRLRSLVTFDGATQELVAFAESVEGELTPRRLPPQPDGPPIAPTATLSVKPSTEIVGLQIRARTP